MKFWQKLGFLSAYFLPILLFRGQQLGEYYNFMAPVAVFGIVPLADFLVGLNTRNINNDTVNDLANDLFYITIVRLWAFVQVLIVVWGCWTAVTESWNWVVWVGFGIGFSTATGGIGITIAHELGHKKNKLDQFLSKLILMTVCYMHFYIEHNQGHHTWVATPHDPATSRKGENFYRFWLRSVVHGWKSAWSIETKRLRAKKLLVFSLQNQMLWFTVLPVVFCGIITVIFSVFLGEICWQVPTFFFVQSVGAFTLLELVNYVEHYGMVRKRLPNGRFERISELHSWNTSHLVSNFFLFHLQRHSDHHAHATRPYQILRHFDQSPQLPQGYPAMVLLALVPPLWFGVMDSKLEHWQRVQQKD